MGEEKRIKAVFQVDSTGFNNSLRNINTSLRNSQSELKLTSEGIKVFGKDSDKLKNIQESLIKQFELQSKKVDIYKESIEKTSKKLEDNIKARDKLKSSLDNANKKYDEAVKLYGKESEEAKKAKEEVDKLTEQYKKKEKAVETNTRSIKNYETNMNKANTELVKTQAELQTVNGELDKSNNKWLNASEGLKKSSEKLKDVGGKISSAGDSILKITAPLAAGGIASLKFATDFADGMAKVSTIADTTKVPLNDLREGALNLSKDFGVSATEMTESMYQAISASVPTEKAVNFVATATKSAKAGFTDAATAVDGLSTVLNSYGIEASKADVIANQMLITQNKGKTSFGELASSMGKITPVASSLGITTEELFSSLASTTAQGLATSESITALKAAMSNIIKPSTEASKAAEALGIDFSVSALKSKGWIGFLQDVKKGLENASPEFKKVQDQLSQNVYKMAELEKQGKKNTEEYKNLNKESNALSKEFDLLLKASDSQIGGFASLFGSVEGLNSVLMLTSDNGMKVYNETMGEMKTNTTALDDAFNKMSNTPGEKFKKSLNSMKVAAIKFGDALVPLMDKGTQVIDKIANALNGLSKEQIESYAKWGMLAIGAGGALKVLGSGISVVGNVVGGIGKLTGVLAKASAVSKGASVATGVASKGFSLMGVATKASTLLLNPWTLAIAGVGIAGVAVAKKLSQDVVPQVDLFADSTVKSTKKITDANGKLQESTHLTTIKISEGTKKALGSYMEMDKKVTETLNNLYFTSIKITKENTKSLTESYLKMGEEIKVGMDKKYTEQLTNLQNFFNNSYTLTTAEKEKALNSLKTQHEQEKAEIDSTQKIIQGIIEQASKEKRALKQGEVEHIKKLQQQQKEKAVKTLSEEELECKAIMEKLKGHNKRLTAESASEAIKNAEKQRQGVVSKANKTYDETVKNIIKMRDETGVITHEQAENMIREAEFQRKETVKKADNMKAEVVAKIKGQNEEVEKSVDISTGKILTWWDKLKKWWNDWQPSGKNFYADVNVRDNTRGTSNTNHLSGKSMRWTGDNYFKGGLTTLHERGEEIYDLPKGTRIYNAERSEQLVVETAEKVAEKVANKVLKGVNGNGNGGVNVTQNIYSPTPSPSEIARQSKNSLQLLALDY